ncbi:CRISPR-associated protein Cas1-like protein [Leptospira borgpetersenii str. Brem 307]|uniref:CRISPR-associated protein Cas1-like protein n=1 Tax=Leptospira borgpetersenii str. Brem 328 TaxID=1049780 RepID=A0ABC9SHS7_LEPBO|nr:CRISPR-associated protein Cas1-like protein [Leptospira borgpetersenii str. Brem 307]EMN17160.1 CRISPR-associated protein Cas1-like protein [Leptospira borgpetersenii str. Brem 328]
MPNRNLQELPKFEDNWSHLYFEKGRIDQFQKFIGFHYLDKVVPIPIETIGLLLLGPGTSITHEAIKRISDSRCLLAWTGEGGVRFYSAGYTGTYSARNLLRQVEAYGNPKERVSVIRKMYQFRFSDEIPADALPSNKFAVWKGRGFEKFTGNGPKIPEFLGRADLTTKTAGTGAIRSTVLFLPQTLVFTEWFMRRFFNPVFLRLSVLFIQANSCPSSTILRIFIKLKLRSLWLSKLLLKTRLT